MQISSNGYFMVSLAALLWAASGTASKYLFLQGMTAIQLVQIRMTLSALILSLTLLSRHRSLLVCRRHDLLRFLFIGVALAVSQFTYLFAISRVPVAAAILLQYQAPVLIALYWLFFLGRRLSLVLAIALASAVIGCYLMVGGFGLDIASMDRAGVISGLVSALAFAAYSLLSEQAMSRYSPWTLVCYALVLGAVIWNIVHPPLSAFRGLHGSASWPLVLFIAAGGTIISFWLYTEGIRLVTSARASITATLEPLFAGLSAYALLHEIMLPIQMLGGGMIVAALLVLQLKKEA